MSRLKVNGLCRVLALVLALLLLSGCGRQDPALTTDVTQDTQNTTQQTGQTEPSQTAPTETEPPETAPTEPPPSLDPITKLSCTRWRTFPQLLSLGGGIVLASRNFYSPEEGAIINSVELIDVYSDTVVQKLMNDGTREPVEQRFADDAFVLADPKNSCFHVYDQQLQLLGRISAPNLDGFFSKDRSHYYYVDSDVLYRMDVASGNRGRITLQQDLRLESLLSIHPNGKLLVARVYLSAFTTNCGIAVIDLENGELKLLTDDLMYAWLVADRFYGMAMNDSLLGYDLYYGKLSGGQVQKLTVEQLSDGWLSCTVLAGSDYLMCKAARDDESGTVVRNLISGQSVDMSEYGFKNSALGTVYLPDEQLIMGFYESGYDFDPVVIDPKVLEYDGKLTAEAANWSALVDDSLIRSYQTEAEGPALPAALSEVRSFADNLEKKYGIQILIGKQVSATCDHSDFAVQTVEDPAAIQAALEQLDTACSRYPKTFLKQFQNGAREGGLYFCLTGQIEGELEPVGFARLNRDRYNLALDITDSGLSATIHHEIWHAIEMKLSTDTFDTKQWSSCNPDGFAYYERYREGYLDLTKWTYANGSGTGSYFVDSYSRINGREDRARIWENVMSTDATELMKASALQKKLSIMNDAIRRVFDTDGWSNVCWEKYL